MNKKGLIGLVLTVILIGSSTAVVSYASKNSASVTKNVVKVVSDKEQIPVQKDTLDTSKNISSKDVAAMVNNDPRSHIVTKEELIKQLKEFEDGSVKTSPENIKSLKDMLKKVENGEVIKAITIVENSHKSNDSNSPFGNDSKVDPSIKLLNITDDEAIKTAKAAIKDYTGVDMEKVIIKDGLKATIMRNNSAYAWGSDILVTFDGNKHQDNIFVSISAVDGKVYCVTAMTPNNTTTKYKIDENKVKEAALVFLKAKGFGANVKSIDFENEKVSAGISGAKCLYEDGTEILLEFSGSNNAVVNFTHYNLKTMKFAK